MPVSFTRPPGPGETRSCTDPWTFIFIQATGNISLCCRSQIVGNLKERSLESILEGPEAVGLRRALLRGELPPDCVRCAERGVTTLDGLRERVEHALFVDGLQEVEQLRVQVRELQDVRAELMRERTALRGHAETIERERDALRQHAAILEAERPQLHGHIANLEAERTRLDQHAGNLTQERERLLAEQSRLREHARNLDAERARLARRIEALAENPAGCAGDGAQT